MNMNSFQFAKGGCGPLSMMDNMMDSMMRGNMINSDRGHANGQENGDAMSHDGILMTEALAVAHNAPDVRAERVAALRERVQNGTYEVDNMRLAEAITRENPGLFRL